MSSGAALSQQCIELKEELRSKKQLRCITLVLANGNTEIVVSETATDSQLVNKEGGKPTPQEVYEALTQKLPEKECRWVIYDFSYSNAEGHPRNKIIILAWAPDKANIRAKMVFAASNDAIKKLEIPTMIQATDYDEVDWETVHSKVAK